VAAEEENNKKNEGKGFAGLSSLVSDVDTAPAHPAPKTESAGSTTSTGRPASQAAQPQPQQPTQRQTYQEPPQPSSGSSGGKWILGIAAVVGLLWLIGQSNKNTPSPAPAYSPPAQSAAPSYSPPAQPQGPSVPQESKPPVGQDLVLSTAQIRYCLAEDIRMEGARAALNNYSDSDVDRFNAMVADYNSRCGSFRYRSGALESARRDVEPYRGQLKAEGRSRFARSSSTGSLSAPAPARPVADETVRAVQQKLNELGYSAGPADGLMGRGTRAAIIAFQQDRGLAATGVADQTLLFQLQRAPSRQTTAETTPSTQSSPPALPNSSRMPDLSRLAYEERSAIQQACILKKSDGAASYNRCVAAQLNELANAPRLPDLSKLAYAERSAIQQACILKKSNGAASYNKCVVAELRALGR
jgi:hypothetical protein